MIVKNIKQAYQLMAQFYENDSLEKAEYICVQVLNVLPNDPKALYTLGKVLIKKKKYTESLEVLHKLLTITPHEHKLHSQLGFLYHMFNQFDQAIKHYQQALGLFPHDEYRQKLSKIKQESEIVKLIYPEERKVLQTIKKPNQLPQLTETKPVNIVLFHVDMENAPRGFSQQTDYKSLIYNIAQVAHHTIPQCKVFLYTDEHTSFDTMRLTYVDEIIRNKVNTKQVMYERMRLRHEYLTSDKFDTDTVFSDVDILFNQDISAVFTGGFDIGLTFRLYPTMPYNGGIIFAKHNKAAIEFSQKWLDSHAFLEAQQPIKARYPKGIKAWYGDQLSLAALISTDIIDMSDLIFANLQLDNINISLFSAEQYNFTPIVGVEYSSEELKEKMIIHFKGSVKHFTGNNVKWYIENILNLNWV